MELNCDESNNFSSEQIISRSDCVEDMDDVENFIWVMTMSMKC